jgi:hypothetical protein
MRGQIETMSPIRRQERPMLDPVMEREMRELCSQLDAMETTQRQTPDTRYVSEAENENEGGPEEQVIAEDAVEERLFKVVARIGSREKLDIPM